jgi:phage baseplate assembly protein W
MKARWRGWRFRVPPYDAPPEEPVGLVIDPSGAIDTVADDEAIRQSLLLLISTTPGERVMRPDYGCDLHRLVFSPNDDTTAGLAIHFVRQAVERFEPRVEVLRVDANRDLYEATRLEVVLDYRARATLRGDRVVVGVDLQEAP